MAKPKAKCVREGGNYVSTTVTEHPGMAQRDRPEGTW